MDKFFFVILPYVAMVLFFGVPVYRAFRGKLQWTARGELPWTTRASGFFGTPVLGVAALALHWGIILLFVAHVIGLLGGYLQNTTLVEIFYWLGLVAGIAFFYGCLVAFIRRIVNPEMRAMSMAEDYIVLIFLLVISGLALYQVLISQVFGMSWVVGQWLAGIYTFTPDDEVMAGASLLTKLHIISASIFFAYFPFTKLVHLWSYPFNYITRPYISMRSYLRTMK